MATTGEDPGEEATRPAGRGLNEAGKEMMLMPELHHLQQHF